MWPGGSRVREESGPDPRRPETAGSEGNSAQEKRSKNKQPRIKTKSETKSEQDVQHMASKHKTSRHITSNFEAKLHGSMYLAFILE
ncbi:hypothetical protein B0H12DRAFT_88769 [Mycena haematopus]|nr:hypothetical protein B0H12DRAFT_88769 [Mycena haematopus]